MTFLVIHADQAATVLSDDPVVRAHDLPRLAEGLSLLAEARLLRQATQARIEAAAEAARAAGHAEGYAAGREAALAEQQRELFALSVRAAAERRRLRADVVALSVEIVRRIAGALGDETVVTAIADRAVADLLPDTVATLRVHPGAAEAVRKRLAQRPGITVEADDMLAGADCILETALGRAHAGLETQLAAIGEAMAQGFPAEKGDGR